VFRFGESNEFLLYDMLTRLWDERLLAARFQEMGSEKLNPGLMGLYECTCQATLRGLVHD
jgi:hypothetical protein